jgi:hypothetical protein
MRGGLAPTLKSVELVRDGITKEFFSLSIFSQTWVHLGVVSCEQEAWDWLSVQLRRGPTWSENSAPERCEGNHDEEEYGPGSWVRDGRTVMDLRIGGGRNADVGTRRWIRGLVNEVAEVPR